MAITIYSPSADNLKVSGVVPIICDATEDTDQCSIFIDGNTLVRLPGQGPYNYGWDTARVTDGLHKIRVYMRRAGGAGSVAGVTRLVNVEHPPPPDIGKSWRRDVLTGTLEHWPEIHFLSTESGVIDASDPEVPVGAPMSKVVKLVADRPATSTQRPRSSIQQKYSVKPDNWDANHGHDRGLPTFWVDPYPEEWIGQDGIEGMERWHREAFAVPSGTIIQPNTILSDWHAYYGVPIVLRTSYEGADNWEVMLRGGMFEFCPINGATGKPTYPAWWSARNADGSLKYPNRASYLVPNVGTFAQESSILIKNVAPIRRGVWDRLVWHINYSTDPSKGFLELYWNGTRRIDYHGPTTFNLIGCPLDPKNNPNVKPGSVHLDGPQALYHQIQAYQPADDPMNPPYRVFVAPDVTTTSEKRANDPNLNWDLAPR
jgi:hypothetical protein